MAEDSGNQQEGSTENHLRQQLAAAVKKIEWTYAIYWSTSVNQQGVLSWSDGYYNGDIKTRKATQAMEFQDEEADQRRSEQLRELYKFLSEGDGDQQTRRPSASLSPEDLTDAEWYYLVCMSFTFTPGKCLPGKAFMSNQHIWLSNAEVAENDIFSRSLLAKSAEIQTVACFPFTNGVLEFGTSELVSKDSAMVQQLTTFLWEMPIPTCTEQTSSPLMSKWDDDTLYSHIGHDIVNNSGLNRKDSVCHAPLVSNGHPALSVILHYHSSNAQKDLTQDEAEDPQVTESEELDTTLSDCCSNECCPYQNNKDSFMMDDTLKIQMIHGGISNDLQDPLNSRDYSSTSIVNAKRVLEREDSHYMKTVTAILRSSQKLTQLSCLPKSSDKSCFTVWKRDLSFPGKPLSNTSQKLLKTIMKVTWICGVHTLKAPGENGEDKRARKLGNDLDISHLLRERRDELNEKFSILRTLVPSISMVDKASILGDTIKYLKELEKRVEALESCTEFVGLSGKREYPDVSERTYNNYGNAGRRCPASKRKACDMIGGGEHHWIAASERHNEVNVRVTEEEVLIQMHCPWRDCLMMEVVESISSLRLDPFSVQSSTSDGIVSITIKSKFRNSIASAGMIKRSLQRVVGKC